MRDIVRKLYQADGGLGDRLEAQLNSLGFHKRRLSAQDTAPLDQLHAGGLEATEKLAQLLSPSRGAYVLDVGSGLGAPSHYLATHYGCRVMGIDITEDYSRIATVLARRMELENQVEYRLADARKFPFPDQTFDAVWTQHVSMNIAEKSRFYAGIFRFLRTGERFAFHDVVQGPRTPVLFPVAVGANGRHQPPSGARRKAANHPGLWISLGSVDRLYAKRAGVLGCDHRPQEKEGSTASGAAPSAGVRISRNDRKFSPKSGGRAMWNCAIRF